MLTPTDALVSVTQTLLRSRVINKHLTTRVDIQNALGATWNLVPNGDVNKAFAELCRRYNV